MKRRITRVMVAFCMCVMLGLMFTGTEADAKTLKSGNYEYEIMEDGTAKITKYNGKESKVTIPSKLGGKKVTRIGYQAFAAWKETRPGYYEDFSTVKQVVFPDTLQCIEMYNFANVTSLHVPKNLTSISTRSFSVDKLTSITVDKRNKVYDSRNNCNAIIEKPNESNGNRVTLVLGCKNTVIPNTVEVIGTDAFINYPNKSIKIPKSVKCIDYCAFMGSKLEKLEMPDTVTSLGGCTFYGCKNLKSVKLSKKLKSVCDCDFEGCTSLKSITIPNSVQMIGFGAFQGCTSLQKVVIGKNLERIGMYAFDGAKNLTSITIKSTKLTKVGKAVLKGTNKKLVIKVPKSKVVEYKKYFKNKGNKTVKIRQ